MSTSFRARAPRFIVLSEGERPDHARRAATERLSCRDVRGFCEAVLCAHDPDAPLPRRIVLVGPGASLRRWVDRWAEDTERVRRTIRLRRASDGEEVTAVVTLSSHGRTIDPSLSVESIRASWDAPLSRSGVHRIAQLAGVLGQLDDGQEHAP